MSDWRNREREERGGFRDEGRDMEARERDRQWHPRGYNPDRDDYVDDRDAQFEETEQDYRPRRRRLGRILGSTGDWTGVGSAAGYTGFGGPGWTSGGFGDPGYNTSGFGSSDYGSSRVGAGATANYTDFDYRVRSSRPQLDPRAMQGPHRGRGPKGYHRSDDRIRDEVCELLTENGAVDASNIDVQVSEGEVTLSGTVETRQMRRIAEDLTETISGVLDVHNQLKAERR
jgi:hypothetical protein